MPVYRIEKSALIKALPNKPVTRFAPSPTGYLHLGHVISMAYVFGLARIAGAKVLLRIEDHDQERSKKVYEQAILDDMAWLGFIPDNWNEFTQHHKTSYRQSDNLELYAGTVKELWQRGLLYSCCCSRKQLASHQKKTADEMQELFYPGLCKGKNLPLASQLGVRIKADPHPILFQDGMVGEVSQVPQETCGDWLIKDRRGHYTYNFAVVVDDLRHGVNWIIRGLDILHCTSRQIDLQRQLGKFTSPYYCHHPLALDQQGKKLSKRSLAEGIIQRRQAGEAPEKVIGDALFIAGLLPEAQPVKAEEISAIITR